jgi:hypothetical protein
VATLRHVALNVKRWQGGEMIRRWVRLGLRRATASFRGIKGHRDLATLATTEGSSPAAHSRRSP